MREDGGSIHPRLAPSTSANTPALRMKDVIWQGWRLSIPRRWDAVKLEGDYSQGYALFADALRPRLGIRWQTPKRKADPEAAVKLAMKNEVGQLAAEEAKPAPGDLAKCWEFPQLYAEPKPPGRDVFSAYSDASGRLFQVAYHAFRRENALSKILLPAMNDLPLERAAPWSIFDLNCVIPGGMFLKSHRLNAGDLALTFADRLAEVTVRQIAVAQVALQRLSLDGWIAEHQKNHRRYHVPSGRFRDVSFQVNQQEITGRATAAIRRWRYSLLWNQPRVLYTLALHDVARDRLILMHGTDESLLLEIAGTVGLARDWQPEYSGESR